MKTRKTFRTVLPVFLLCLPFLSAVADSQTDSARPLFVYTTVEGDTVDILADRFATTPDRIRSWNPDFTGMAGEPLRLPNRSPFKLESLAGAISPEEFAVKSGESLETVKRMNVFILSGKRASSVFVREAAYSPWILYRPFFENALEKYVFLAWPLVILIALLAALFAYGAFQFVYFLIKFLRAPGETSAATPAGKKEPSIVVEIKKGSRENERFTFAKNEITIGRTSDNDLSLPEDAVVSSHHLRIFAKADGWFLKDLDSSNGTMIGRRKVFEHRLALGDEVELGFDGPLLRFVPYVPEQAAAFGSRGTTYIAAVVSRSIKKRTAVYKYAFAVVALALLGLFLANLILSRRVTLIAQNVKAHQQQIQKLQTQMDRMDENLASMKTRQADLEQKVRGLEGHYDEIARTVAGNTESIERIKETLRKLPDALKNGGEAIEEFSRAVRALNDAVINNDPHADQRIEEVEEKYNRVAQYVSIVSTADEYFNRPASGNGSTDVALIQNTLNESRSNLDTAAGPALETLRSLVSNGIVKPTGAIRREVDGVGPLASLL